MQNARALRNALGNYPTGVTVVTTTTAEGRPVGLTVNSFASLSLEPPLLLWSLSNQSTSLRAFRMASHFVINVLAADQAHLATRFATPGIADKFAGVALQSPSTAAMAAPAPVLSNIAAHFVCATRDVLEAGDHSLFIGRVEHHQSATVAPLVFYGGKFAQVASASV